MAKMVRLLTAEVHRDPVELEKFWELHEEMVRRSQPDAEFERVLIRDNLESGTALPFSGDVARAELTWRRNA